MLNNRFIKIFTQQNYYFFFGFWLLSIIRIINKKQKRKVKERIYNMGSTLSAYIHGRGMHIYIKIYEILASTSS